MKTYDTIVIGSGAGGLAAAICLARAGQKVLVLEQHYVPGGWCHSFQINGYRFSPGVHYVGLVGEGQSTNEMYKGLGIANDMVFFKMNPKGYEHCLIENERIDMPEGIDSLYESLVARFPHEAKGLKKYLNLIEKVSQQIQLIPKMKGFWEHLTIPFRTKEMGKYGLFSLKRVIDWHIKDPLLKAVLNVQCGDHGLPPFKASFPVHCVLMAHYLDGAYYPMGGGGGIVKAMTNGLKRFGGELRTEQNVNKIIIKDKKAIGVEIEGGEQIFATNIISNADPNVTFFNLVGKQNISEKLNKRLLKTKYSVASIILFLTLDYDVTKVGIDSGNVWHITNKDLDKVYDGLIDKNVGAGEMFSGVFISCTTLKDPVSFNGRYHNFEIVTYIDYDSFSQFNHGGDYHSEAYSLLKEKIINKLLNNLNQLIPDVRQYVVQLELGTPKTNEFYINSTRGNVYGTEKTLKNVGPMAYKNKTEIEGLFLCGSSTLSHGVAGATNSGIQAAAQILNCKSEDLLIEDENQHLRIYDAEDTTTWPDWVLQKRADKLRRFKELVPQSHLNKA